MLRVKGFWYRTLQHCFARYLHTHVVCVCMYTHICTCVYTHIIYTNVYNYTHVSVCIFVSFPPTSGSFQSSSHQKHFVFTHFYKLTMEWLLNLWFIKMRASKITTFLITFLYKCTVNTFFLHKKTVPQWFKLKQQQQQQQQLLSTACNTIKWWIGATVSPVETVLQVEFLKLPAKAWEMIRNARWTMSFCLPLFFSGQLCFLSEPRTWNTLSSKCHPYLSWQYKISNFPRGTPINDYSYIQWEYNELGDLLGQVIHFFLRKLFQLCICRMSSAGQPGLLAF